MGLGRGAWQARHERRNLPEACRPFVGARELHAVRLGDSTGRCYQTVAAASLRLDMGCADHLAPLFGFICDEFPKIRRSLRKCRGTKAGDPRLNRGIGQRRLIFLLSLSIASAGVFRKLGRNGPDQARAVPATGAMSRMKLKFGLL
jgi:hypothetical protein